MHACMLQGCLWIDSLMLNLLMGKKRKMRRKGKSILNPKTKEHTQQQQHKTLKLIPLAPTHIQRKEI
jgi:hypothetical protein